MEKDGELSVPESEKMLAEINAAKQAAAAQEASKSEEGTQSAQSTEGTPSQPSEEKAAPGKSGQAVSQNVVESAPVKTDKQGDDVREWAKKKGFKDEESILRSFRELEREYHRSKFEAKKDAPRGTFEPPVQPPAYQPTPSFQQPSYQPPAYSYPPNPMDREKILEMEAAKRGWDKEDFRKVLELADEVSEMKARRIQAQNETRYRELEREKVRSEGIRELMRDPLFTNEEVVFEMHNVLKENPQAFTLEPSPELYAFKEAQMRLVRKKILQGNGNQSEARSLPSNPPPDTGKGSNPSIEQTKENQILEKFKQAKTAEEQKKILESLGAVQTY